MNRSLPPVGTKLIGRRQRGGVGVHAKIVSAHDFPLGRAVEVAGQRYASLSAAAKAVCGHEANGWVWWRGSDGRLAGEAFRT